ncbi:MAG: SAM-dependent methyltransferase [Chloroflexi bacterium]|nr:SAM-dependent methyltransferase [Chloroflexota bacterium]
MAGVEDVIREHISREGRITFADFMEMALYYPGVGYYTSGRERVGAEGDFYTSPATHPVFAALIALQIEQMWQVLGRPPDFNVVEMGAGKGLLAKDILAYLPSLRSELVHSLTYVSLERAKPALRARQGEAFEPVPEAEATPGGAVGCFLSNELLDALPVHRVAMRRGRLREAYVTLRDGRFTEVLDRPSTPLLGQRLAVEGIKLPEGCITEVNLGISPWMDGVAAKLERGFVLTIDYGYPAEELYSLERSSGTLVTYYRHTYGQDPYIRIGSQDITTHVDFTAAMMAGAKRGLSTLGLTTQRQFLLNLGFNRFMDALAGKGLDYTEYLANRMAMQELVRPEGIGGFKILVQGTGVAAAPLYALTPADPQDFLPFKNGDLPVPLLKPEHIPLMRAKYPQYFPPMDFDSSDM